MVIRTATLIKAFVTEIISATIMVCGITIIKVAEIFTTAINAVFDSTITINAALDFIVATTYVHIFNLAIANLPFLLTFAVQCP